MNCVAASIPKRSAVLTRCFVGLCIKDIHGGITIIDGLEEYFEDVSCQEIERHLPGDMTIRLLCYASDAVSVAEHFRGMHMLEFCCGDLTVTASI